MSSGRRAAVSINIIDQDKIHDLKKTLYQLAASIVPQKVALASLVRAGVVEKSKGSKATQNRSKRCKLAQNPHN